MEILQHKDFQIYSILQSYWSVPVKYFTLEHNFYKWYSTVEHEFCKFTTTIKLLHSIVVAVYIAMY